MSSFYSLTYMLIFLIHHSVSDLCEKCDCYPQNKPIQIFCENSYSSTDQNLTILDKDIHRDSVKNALELIYIYGYNSVEFASNSLSKLTVPVNIFIHHCSQVTFHENALKLIRSLTVANVEDLTFDKNALNRMQNTLSIKLTNVKIKIMPYHSLYDISPLNVLEMNDVTVQHIEKEAIRIDQASILKLQNCVVGEIEPGAISIYGDKAQLKNNLFTFIPSGGITLHMESLLSIINCTFHEYKKSALHLNSPGIEISSNYFMSLPASALAQVNTNESINFTYNIIENIDLGGVILDMDYRRINFANNTIDCDCSPKKTSILTPKDRFPVFINFEQLFYNNFCQANCTVSLKNLSYGLLSKHICSDSTENELTDDILCNTTSVDQEYYTTSRTDETTMFDPVNASHGSLSNINCKEALPVLVIIFIVRSVIT